MTRKGIILAGGAGSRLYPLTLVASKQLLPIYNKPMIYYPLSVLMLGGIREILIISTPQHALMFQELLGDGGCWGLSLSYAIQSKPRGVADALVVGESFLNGAPSALILGDNIFYGDGLPEILREANQSLAGASLFAYRVRNPAEYGVIEFDDSGRVLSIDEKPELPRSDWAVTGLYFYDNTATKLVRTLQPSPRNELEITDLNRLYLDAGKLAVSKIGRGFAWLDTGTFDSLLEAGEFVRAIEHRQGLKVACLEEIAMLNGWISATEVADIGRSMPSSEYGRYLLQLSERR